MFPYEKYINFDSYKSKVINLCKNFKVQHHNNKKNNSYNKNVALEMAQQ
jgi:hypothetical protein